MLVRSVGTLQDITRDKAVEQLLQDAKDDLESQVRRRTSELREANQALEISQAQLAAFFKHAPMVLCMKDLDGRYVMVNPITEELYQRPADQIVGKLPHDLFSTDIAHALVAHDRAVLETGQAEIREISGEIDGEQRSYLSTKFAISNASDSPNGLGAIVLDITDQKQSEEALKSSERRYRELFEQSPLPTFEENWSAIKLIVDELSRTGVSDLLQYFKDNPDQLNKVYDLANCFDINEAALRLYRASSADQLQNDLHHAVATPVLLQGYAAAVAAFHSGASRYECEVDEVALDGTPLTTQIKFLLPDSYRDDWSRVLLTVVDLTDRKVMEDELRHSEERYRELFEESPAVIWEEDWRPIRRMLEDLTQSGVKDLRGYFVSQRDQLRAAYGAAVILEISQAAIDLYRQESKEDIIRTSSSTRVIDQELDAFLEILLAFWAGQTEVDIDSMDTTGDDIGIIVHRRIVIPKKYRDDWSRVIYAIEDITERTRLEGYFRQAQKMEAVGQLTGGIAHDFNNLLAVVQGNAEMLIRSGSDGKPMAEAIMRAAGRGSELTQRLLAYSRQQPLAPKVIDVSELATEMLELLSRVLGETIEIATYVQPGIWHALADPGQVENAVLNLALNARDAMPDGGKLTIECTNERLDGTSASAQPDAKAGKYVVLTVSDTGCGMSAETLEHASDPFFTTKEVGQGSGLGLSMVYGFAKQSGGHLTIESSLVDGTTVKLYLPSAEEKKSEFGTGHCRRRATWAWPDGPGD